MGSCDRGFVGRAVLAAALLVWPTAAFAQSAPAAPAQAAPAPPSREELNPATRVPAAPSRERDLFAPEPPGPCPLRASPLRFTLKSVAFTGKPALAPEVMARASAGLVGQEIPISAICDIRDRATRILFDHGVLARVKIPQQQIADGALVLEVLTAHVVNVRIKGDAGHAQEAVERYLGKLRGMDPFDMRQAQRWLLLASDVPGVQVRAAIRPSITGEAGAVDLDVTVSARAVDVVANVQNLESETIGRWGGLVRADVQNLTPFGDRTSLIGYHTLDSDEQWVVQLLEEARLGGDGLLARGSLVYGETRPGGPVSQLDLESRSFVAEAEVAYPLLRSRRRNLTLAGGFDVVEESTDALGSALFRDRLRVFYLRAAADARFQALSRVVQTSAALTVRKGVDGLGATSRGSFDSTRPDGAPDALLVRGSARVATVLFDRLQASAQVQAQYAADPLFSYERFALGNLTIGRGYDPAVVLGDSGASGAFELRYGPLRLNRLVLAQPYVFYDAGYVNDRGAGALFKDRVLTSAGLGVLLRLAERANLDINYAKPFQAPLPGSPRPTPRLLVNLTVDVF